MGFKMLRLKGNLSNLHVITIYRKTVKSIAEIDDYQATERVTRRLLI